jgi:hypothetical protein
MPLHQIIPGTPPLLWSNVDEAFNKINANFETLSASIGGGGSLIDWEQFDNSIIPTTSNSEVLGSFTNRWKSVHVDSYRETLTDTMNGVWIGPAHIKGIDATVDLPVGSTVNGSLIIDPNKTFFKRVSVDDFNVIEANDFSDTLNLIAGTATQLVVDSSAESITINNIGVTALTAGTAIGISSTTGNITVTNTGVTRLTNTSALPSGLTAGSGISVSAANGAVLITNTGVLQVQQGFGITVSTDPASGIATISNSAPAQVTFRNYVINGDTLNPIVADSTSDTMYVNTGYGLITTKDVASDTFSISLNQNIDILGSVFADNSTMLVDGADGKIVGPVYTSILRTSETKIALGENAGDTNQGLVAVAIGGNAGRTNQGGRSVAIGYSAGNTTQGTYSVAIGNGAAATSQGGQAVAIGTEAGLTNQGNSSIAIGPNAGDTNQGSNGIALGYYAGKNTQGTGAVALGYTTAQITQGEAGVAIGWSAGQTNQGAYSIAIGYRAGFVNQHAASIVLNASGALLNTTGAGFFVNPIRPTSSSAKAVMYDTATSELFYSSTLEFIGSTISTSDSTGLTVDVQTTFNTDVTFENDITVAERLTVKGSRVINLNELKSITAASTSFSDFQARIAALV